MEHNIVSIVIFFQKIDYFNWKVIEKSYSSVLKK